MENRGLKPFQNRISVMQQFSISHFKEERRCMHARLSLSRLVSKRMQVEHSFAKGNASVPGTPPMSQIIKEDSINGRARAQEFAQVDDRTDNFVGT